MKIKEIRHVSPAELTSLLTRIPFFKELRLRDEKQLQLLLGYSCLVDLDAGETIMRRGEKGSWLYFLVKGKLVVYRDRPDPDDEINVITPGELFGEMAVVDSAPRSASAVAVGNTELLVIDRAEFDRRMQEADATRAAAGR